MEGRLKGTLRRVVSAPKGRPPASPSRTGANFMTALRLFNPTFETAASSPPPLRFESATVGEVLEWFSQNNPKPSRSEISAHEMARVWRLFGDRYGRLLCKECRPYMLL